MRSSTGVNTTVRFLIPCIPFSPSPAVRDGLSNSVQNLHLNSEGMWCTFVVARISSFPLRWRVCVYGELARAAASRYKERLKGSVEISRASMHVLLVQRSWRAWLTLANEDEDTSLIRLNLMRTLEAGIWGGEYTVGCVCIGRVRCYHHKVITKP